ncbi:MAG: LytR/AlgR family response regulator transcription factor [Saprospiraceae bacterium]
MKSQNVESGQLVAIIVDDELPVAQALEKLLRLYCKQVQFLTSVECIADCLAVLAENEVDLVFLDIALGGESGFDLFQKVPYVDFQVIFTTSYSEFAIKAIRAEAVDYLLKPIDPIELKSAVNRAMSRKEEFSESVKTSPVSKDEQVSVSTNGIAVVTSAGINLLQHEEIVHVEGSGSYSTFHMKDGPSLIASRNLMHYERLIESETFFRTHQSHLINLAHLKSFNASESQVHLTGDRLIPVSKTKKPLLLDRIRDLYRGA